MGQWFNIENRTKNKSICFYEEWSLFNYCISYFNLNDEYMKTLDIEKPGEFKITYGQILDFRDHIKEIIKDQNNFIFKDWKYQFLNYGKGQELRSEYKDNNIAIYHYWKYILKQVEDVIKNSDKNDDIYLIDSFAM